MDIFLARQPIFDSSLKVNSYEILYRNGTNNEYDAADGTEASRKVIFNAFQSFGIQNLTNNKPAFINFTEEIINDEIATLFSKEHLFIEVLESVVPNEDVIESIKTLKSKGYKIVLDDFVYSPIYEELLSFTDIVKLDFLGLSRKEIEKISRYLKAKGITLLAEKIETYDDFEFAKDMGFSLFQGYFFSKPEILKTNSIKPIKANYLKLIELINEENIDFVKISDIISMDLSLSYNLLKLVNSTYFGFRFKIKTIKHALVALGTKEIKKWIYLVYFTTLYDDVPDELTRMSLIRARFSELIAVNTKYKMYSEDLFLMGLFSLLDVILKRPMADIFDELKVKSDIKDALISRTGIFSSFYKMLIAYEKAEWDKTKVYAEELSIECQIISKAYIEALLWYNEIAA